MTVDEIAPEIVSRRLIELSLTRPPVHSFNRQLVRIVVDTVGATAATLWLLHENELVLVEEIEERPGAVRGIGLSDQDQQAALRSAYEQGEAVVLPDGAQGLGVGQSGLIEHDTVVFLPVVGLHGNLGVLRLVFAPMHPVVLSRQVQLAETLSGYYSLYSAQRILTAQHEERQDIDRLSKAILQLQHYSFSNQLPEVIVNSAVEVARLDRVVLLAARQGGDLRLAAVSSVAEPDRKSAWSRLACELGNLVLQGGKPVQFLAGVTNPEDIPDEELRRQLNSYVLMTDVKSLMIFPLSSREDKAGALIVESMNEQPLSQFERVLCTVYATHVASALVNNRLFRSVPFARLLGSRLDRDLERVSRGRSWPARAAKAVIILAAVALAAWFVAIHEVPEKIGAKCYVEPMVVRVVTAPMDGEIQEVFFAKGEDVEQGQILLGLRKDLIQLNLDGARKDAESVMLQVHQLRGESLRAGIPRDQKNALLGQLAIKERQLDVKTKDVELWETRLARCDVRAPVAGTIVEPADPGLLRTVQVREGEPLCRVGDIFESVRVKVAVPASRIQDVKPGMAVEIQLRSLVHDRVLDGQIESISRRSENYKNANVFMADVVLPQMTGRDGARILKPGMDGKAKVIRPERSTYLRIYAGALGRKLQYWLF